MQRETHVIWVGACGALAAGGLLVDVIWKGGSMAWPTHAHGRVCCVALPAQGLHCITHCRRRCRASPAYACILAYVLSVVVV